MKIVYPAAYESADNLFYFRAKWFNYIYLIMPSDTFSLQDIESRVVKKIIRTTYRDAEDKDFKLYYREQLI
jgi:hypothetical protein